MYNHRYYRRLFIFKFFGRHIYFLGWTPLRDHPPPNPPFQCPPPNKKGTNLLLLKFCILLHTHQDLNLKCCRGMGQILRYGRPCLNDSPGTGLHGSTLLQFFRIPLTISCWHNPGSLEGLGFRVNCCFIGLTHPAACTRARVPLSFGHVHRPPSSTQFAQKGCQSTELELRILTM